MVARETPASRRERLRIALFADIHANREAFEACLADARRRAVDRFVFLGDIVGYGADPAFCVDTVARACGEGAVALLGNHDAAIGTPTESMNTAATRAIEWTRGQLDAAQAAFLAGLPLERSEGEVLFVHANGWAPRDWGYVRSAVDAERSLRSTTQRLTFCGHTHVPVLFHMAPMRPPAEHVPTPNRGIPLSLSRRWLAVIGSVGQPRDGNPAACYGLLETSPWDLTYVRVPYDTSAAAAKIRKAGLPESLAARLERGL
jgi:diadenosine tetraphosphatase ApaH/serine/threonine PP2A family protein phosphatase